MLTLSRGGPTCGSRGRGQAGRPGGQRLGRVFNVNGTLTARVVVSQRVPVGMCLMYHAQERS